MAVTITLSDDDSEATICGVLARLVEQFDCASREIGEVIAKSELKRVHGREVQALDIHVADARNLLLGVQATLHAALSLMPVGAKGDVV